MLNQKLAKVEVFPGYRSTMFKGITYEAVCVKVSSVPGLVIICLEVTKEAG